MSIGSSSGSALPLAPRLELYRPFAAHAVGFPIVTLGFRVKSLLSSWRMRIRRREVRRQNDFYEKVLADAVPQPMEERRHFISSQHYTSLVEAQQQDALDYADVPIADAVPQSEERGGREQPLPILAGSTNNATNSGLPSSVASVLAPTKRNPSHRSTQQQLLPATKPSVSAAACSVVAANGQQSTAHKRTTKMGCWRSLNTNNLATQSNHTENGVAGRKRETQKRPTSFSYGNEPLGERAKMMRVAPMFDDFSDQTVEVHHC